MQEILTPHRSAVFASSPLPLDFLALQRSNAGCSFSSGAPWWRLCVVSPSAPSCGLGVMSEVFQTGGPELREGEEKGGGRGGKRGWQTSLSSLLFLLSPCFAGWDEFSCADCGLPSSTWRLDIRQGNVIFLPENSFLVVCLAARNPAIHPCCLRGCAGLIFSDFLWLFCS